jgi:hypothetical protein
VVRYGVPFAGSTRPFSLYGREFEQHTLWREFEQHIVTLCQLTDLRTTLKPILWCRRIITARRHWRGRGRQIIH